MTAIISECGLYRYVLTREGGTLNLSAPPLLFVMLNPSTADADQDDPTIRRCRGFAAALGYSGITVVNLYALRATNPKDLWCHPNPVGPSNEFYIRHHLGGHGQAVCAWGANAKDAHVRNFMSIAEQTGAELMCLGTTKSGAPRHPLYVRGDQPLIAWEGQP